MLIFMDFDRYIIIITEVFNLWHFYSHVLPWFLVYLNVIWYDNSFVTFVMQLWHLEKIYVVFLVPICIQTGFYFLGVHFWSFFQCKQNSFRARTILFFLIPLLSPFLYGFFIQKYSIKNWLYLQCITFFPFFLSECLWKIFETSSVSGLWGYIWFLVITLYLFFIWIFYGALFLKEKFKLLL